MFLKGTFNAMLLEMRTVPKPHNQAAMQQLYYITK